MKNIDLFVDYSRDSQNDLVYSDFNRVRQIIINLLSNAIKFTKQGYVKIEIDSTFLDEIIIKVSDTGVGIDEANLEQIFSHFSMI